MEQNRWLGPLTLTVAGALLVAAIGVSANTVLKVEELRVKVEQLEHLAPSTATTTDVLRLEKQVEKLDTKIGHIADKIDALTPGRK
jgi:peptidoglycan hydrolase CwlO-like protein